MKEILWLALSGVAVALLMWALERTIADGVEKGIRQSGILEALEDLKPDDYRAEE